MRMFSMLPLLLLVVTTIGIGIPKAGAFSNTMGTETETDRLALLDIKSKVTLDPHKALQSWNDSIDVCLWEGVTCGRRHKRVTRLNLTAKGVVGTLSPFVGNLSFLHYLALNNNTFRGLIPPQVGRLGRLRTLDLLHNEFEGEIPSNISACLQLTYLGLDFNKLSGKIPFELSLLSKLQVLGLSANSLTGNNLSPLSNLTSLQELYLSHQTRLGGAGFWGTIPEFIGNFKGLKILALGVNSFTGKIPPSLYNLSMLQTLSLADNLLEGSLPPDFGFFFPQLQWLQLRDNRLSGPVPFSLSNLSSLQVLELGSNNFTGKFLFDAHSMTNFSFLNIHDANLGAGEADDLNFIDTLVNCSGLQKLAIGDNYFGGVLPQSIVRLSTKLRHLAFFKNQISGSIPSGLSRYFKASQLIEVDLSNNHLQGSLPSEIGDLKELMTLDLSSNSFVGFNPSSFSLLNSLQEIDLSNNKLSGQVPTYFSNFSSLVLLNLSFNNLEGDVPTSGVFTVLNVTKLAGNSKLCGGIPELNLPTCPKKESNRKAIVIIAASISCALVGLAILCSIFLLHSRRRRRRNSSSPSAVVQFKEPFTRVSHAMLLKATNNFSTGNFIGSGSYGSVYKGTLFLNGVEQAVAIKVINNRRQGASKSFTAECKALRTIRHRNLVGVITACSSIDFQGNTFQALVYELMPKGSLERWLYSNPEEDSQVSNLTLLQRLNIAIDVAHALDYLHNGSDTPIIHCDLKPSNILLDEDIVAHVGDFGLMKLLPEVSEQAYSNSSVGVRGTIGYVAPEYGLGASVSAAGDVYSYGIILLELMTAKKSTDVMLEGGVSLQRVAELALPEQVLEIVDPKLRVSDHDEEEEEEERQINLNDKRVTKCVFECITSIIMTGVRCSSELPQGRMDIKEVIRELHSQRDRLLLCGRHRCQFIL